jgi:outer membrane protein OmpA-like peptidoglycan-associated protein
MRRLRRAPAGAAFAVVAVTLAACAGAPPTPGTLGPEVRRLQDEARSLAGQGDAARDLDRSVALSDRAGAKGVDAAASTRYLEEARGAALAALAATVRVRREDEADSCRHAAADAYRDWQDALRMLVQSERVAERAARGVTRTEPPEVEQEPLPDPVPAPPDTTPDPEALSLGMEAWTLAARRLDVPVSDLQGRILDALSAAQAPKIDPEVRDHRLRLAGWAWLEMAERVRAEAARREARDSLERAILLSNDRDQALWAMVDLERSMKDTARNQLEEERQRQADREQKLYESLQQFQGKFASIHREARGTIMSLSDILFDFGKADLRRDAELNLAKVAVILSQFPEMKIVVEGHTDNVGSEEYNLKLSERRATAVSDFLISQGVDEARMDTKGYGMSQPIESNATPEGRQKNRRVDLVIREEN